MLHFLTQMLHYYISPPTHHHPLSGWSPFPIGVFVQYHGETFHCKHLFFVFLSLHLFMSLKVQRAWMKSVSVKKHLLSFKRTASAHFRLASVERGEDSIIFCHPISCTLLVQLWAVNLSSCCAERYCPGTSCLRIRTCPRWRLRSCILSGFAVTCRTLRTRPGWVLRQSTQAPRPQLLNSTQSAAKVMLSLNVYQLRFRLKQKMQWC